MKFINLCTGILLFCTITVHSQVEIDWISHYASGLLPGFDGATAIASDGNGYIYVAGASDNNQFSLDFLTIKYDLAGNVLWERRYDNESGYDYPIDIAVDNSGNVYVTGMSDENEIITIKYNSLGQEEWVASYENTTPVAMEADSAGNVYITGWDFAENLDVVIIKYDTFGAQEWVTRYDGPGNSTERSAAIALDATGNIYVAGESRSSGSNGYDYLTLKYNSLGDSLWAARYDGPQNDNDRATAIAIDLNGNVFVTGESISTPNNFGYLTVKYNTFGDTMWTARYDGPGNYDDEATAIEIGPTGNAYVAGLSEYKITTIKYSSNGDLIWLSRIEEYLFARSVLGIAVDIAENIYITGHASRGIPLNLEWLIAKYDSSGDSLWTVNYSGHAPKAIVLDPVRNTYVTGSSYDGVSVNYATIRYDPATGDEVWEAHYDGPGTSEDMLRAMTSDASGNVYVTGTSSSSFTSTDFATVKFDDSGDTVWIARFNGSGNDNQASGITVDGSGNVYVTGSSNVSGSDLDYATLKYDANGNLEWSTTYDAAGLDDTPTVITSDALGNIYVGGMSRNPAGVFDCATIKYSPLGDSLWVRRYKSSENIRVTPTAIRIGSSGNVYVSGITSGYSSGFTLKYNSSGELQWTRRLGFAMSIDASENVYVAENLGLLTRIIKYDTSGDTLWMVNDSSEALNAIEVDDGGNVYLTGFYVDMNNYFNCLTVKYDDSGNREWAVSYDKSDNDFGRAITVDAEGNVYVHGISSHEWLTIKYSPNGSLIWETIFQARVLASYFSLNDNGNVYVAGSSRNSSSDFYTIIKYIETPNGLKETTISIPGPFRLSQNYPNPFNPGTTIEFALPQTDFVTLKVYNILGEEVVTLVSERLTAGQYEYLWDASDLASGVYLYRIQAGGYMDVKKMVLLR